MRKRLTAKPLKKQMFTFCFRVKYGTTLAFKYGIGGFMISSKQFLKIFLTVSAAAFLTACGSNKNQANSSDFSSRSPVSTTTTSSTKPLAYCNHGAGTEINMKLKNYTDSSNTARMDFVYVRMTSLPANFKDSTTYISMWKWLSNSSGYTYLDSTSLQFILLDSSNGQALTGWKNTLRWSDIVTTASGMGITDVQTFFDRVNILVDLKDTKGEYDVLKITNYDLSTNKAISQTDALLPLFYANPADYAYEADGSARSQVLQRLHPFSSNMNQGYTTAQFQSMANDFCF